MSPRDLAGNDWETARQAGHTLAMVVELGLLPPEQRQRLFTEHPVWPLLEQPEVEHLRIEGPALIELSGHPFAMAAQFDEQLVKSAQHGWLSSPLDIIELRQHMGDALAGRNINGEPLLIRSYAHNVLPLLHARHDQPWHAWLFGPIAHWWLPARQGWQRLEGLAQNTPSAYHAIELDQRLVDELGVDPHAQALVAELQSEAPEVFTSDCHGERLNQASQALSQARAAGLSCTQDQYFFALYSLLSGSPMSQRPQWPDILQQVEQQGRELAEVQLEQDQPG
jgi:hypothetical protein